MEPTRQAAFETLYEQRLYGLRAAFFGLIVVLS
jgi:hypothetical protein